ncbi:PIR Superfamily Protein [Plasmodium ovale wallikeri]|uniref:PIR Superfamily Protein n=1 Tax=Plasmodium ovale wallikeri TaxID=864142 RepID=A0A1A9AHY2_PLAOA|nr:PIR Superfamily Protein [Plasmodium ovale wallikeri]SBT56204.1 PIR Superfamily Protein [Plasmodium ovale wallikeri]
MYNAVCEFSKLKDIFDSNIENGVYKSQCESILNCSESGNSNPLLDICSKSLYYLYSLKQNRNISLNSREGCIYLSYRLYKDLISVGNHDYTTSKFHSKINVYDDTYDECDGLIEDINQDVFQKYENLISLYVQLGKILIPSKGPDCVVAKNCADSYNNYVKECYKNTDDAFCNELENVRTKYYETMITVTCPGVPKTLPSTKPHNIAAIIITPLVILLIITFIIFILYKFTPYASWIDFLIRRKKRMWNNLDNETYELSHSSDSPKRNSGNENYHIAY